MDKILEKNLKKPLLFLGDLKKLSAIERKRAYLKALENKGISVDENLILDSNYSREKAYELMKDVLKNRVQFDSIFSSSDNMLYGIIKALEEEKINYKDIEIWGFDNLKYTVPLGMKTVSPMLKETAKNSIDFLTVESENCLTESSFIKYTKVKLIENMDDYFQN
ncbi:MAG: substrate-binding domain-containing protein, partial [Cetobacterium sp.]